MTQQIQKQGRLFPMLQHFIKLLNNYLGALALAGTIGVFGGYVKFSSMVEQFDQRIKYLETFKLQTDEKNQRDAKYELDQATQVAQIAQILQNIDEKERDIRGRIDELPTYIEREINRSIDVFRSEVAQFKEQSKKTERELRILQDDYGRVKTLLEVKLNTEIEH